MEWCDTWAKYFIQSFHCVRTVREAAAIKKHIADFAVIGRKRYDKYYKANVYL